MNAAVLNTQAAPTWHLYRFLENASFLLPHWFLRSLYLLALQCGPFTGLVLRLSGGSIALWLDHTQAAVFQSLLPKKTDTPLLFRLISQVCDIELKVPHSPVGCPGLKLYPWRWRVLEPGAELPLHSLVPTAPEVAG